VATPTGPKTEAQIAALTSQVAALSSQTVKQQELSQHAAGAVYGAQNANAGNPTGLPKEATSVQLEEAASALPAPTSEQKLAKELENARILAGELLAVKAEMGQAINENQRLRAELLTAQTKAEEANKAQQAAKAMAELERKEAAAKLQVVLDAQESRIASALKDAQDKAKAEQRRWITGIFFGLGALLVAGGIVVLVAAGSVPMFGPKAAFGLMGAGGGLITLGIVITQIQNFFDRHPWIVGGALLACGIAALAAVVLMWSNHAHDVDAKKPITST
jgi:hypothetical protein